MAANWPTDTNLGDMSRRLGFFKNLQRVTNKIHGTSNANEILLEMSEDICELFHCDRLTIYLVSDDRQSIVSKVKTGLASHQDIRLPISEQSIAGYVAATGQTVNIRDVYDELELAGHGQRLCFLKDIDQRTGYRSKQMLVAPIINAQQGELLGVVQLINNRSDTPFPAVAEEGIQALAQTLAVAFAQRLQICLVQAKSWSGLPSAASRNGRSPAVDEDVVRHVAGSTASMPATATDREVVRLVNQIILDACQRGASDIHIEPRSGQENTLIRFRRDGVLAPYLEIPPSFRSALLARIKIMSDLDVSEKGRTQYGKIGFGQWGPLNVELRVLTVPTAGGLEDMVLRIRATGEPTRLTELGLSPLQVDRLQALISRPCGLLLVCGTGGCGATTTLHSILNHLNRSETKIWTVEDPVEITQEGLRQVQVNTQAGLDFATVMRALLRADPNVIMVGEVRDRETLTLAVEAALRGHLVFASLRAKSAAESIQRLLDMGVEPVSLADALLGILAQRLVRRLCKSCREAYQPRPEEMRFLLTEFCAEMIDTQPADPQAVVESVRQEWLAQYARDGVFTLYRAGACEACAGSGYHGYVGLQELLSVSDRIRQQIQERARREDLVIAALNHGMRTLKMDGIEKVLSGITDLQQVRAVCSI